MLPPAVHTEEGVASASPATVSGIQQVSASIDHACEQFVVKLKLWSWPDSRLFQSTSMCLIQELENSAIALPVLNFELDTKAIYLYLVKRTKARTMRTRIFQKLRKSRAFSEDGCAG